MEPLGHLQTGTRGLGLGFGAFLGIWCLGLGCWWLGMFFCGLGLLFRVSGLEGWASGLLNENGCYEIVWLPLTLWLPQEWHVT